MEGAFRSGGLIDLINTVTDGSRGEGKAAHKGGGACCFQFETVQTGEDFLMIDGCG